MRPVIHHQLKNFAAGALALLPLHPRRAPTVLVRMERWAAHRPADPFLWFEGRQWTIGAFNAEVNRHAAAWRQAGVGPGDVVGLMMDNRPSFLMHFYGLQKARAIASLINPNLTGPPLVHAVASCGARAVVFGEPQRPAVRAALSEPGLANVQFIIDPEDADAGAPSHAATAEPGPVKGPSPSEPAAAAAVAGAPSHAATAEPGPVKGPSPSDPAAAAVAAAPSHAATAEPGRAKGPFASDPGVCVAAAPGDEPPMADWREHLVGASAANPAGTAAIALDDTAALIYTSGTTGLPKPAIVKHHRLWRVGTLMAAGLWATPRDGIYNCLPLYHSNGIMVAASFALAARCRYALARRFSARRFWRDCVEADATVAIYIGETCRYLLATAPGPYDRAHRVQRVVGNGLRPDVWEPFCERFGIDQVFEFYGSTEGNAETANATNTTGSCGVLLPGKMALARYDVDAGALVRDARGFVPKARPGEPGLLLGRIRPGNEFAGYTDPGATDRKVLRDVFKRGDAWFDTGDLLRRDRWLRLYFVDRIGDTFRWRGENVSTTEVAEQLHGAPSIAECNVYGVAVPGNEGRAGMAAVVLDGPLDGRGVFAHLARVLPAYAQPRVLRVVAGLETTGTFKHLKGQLRDQGFDPAVVAEPLWLRDPREQTYVPLTPARYRDVVAGRWPL